MGKYRFGFQHTKSVSNSGLLNKKPNTHHLKPKILTRPIPKDPSHPSSFPTSVVPFHSCKSSLLAETGATLSPSTSTSTNITRDRFGLVLFDHITVFYFDFTCVYFSTCLCSWYFVSSYNDVAVARFNNFNKLKYVVLCYAGIG